MLPGDIVLSLGKWGISETIASSNRGWSHASLVVATDPCPLIVEAVPPAAKCVLLADLLDCSRKATLLHDLSLTGDERRVVVEAGMKCVGQLYGLDRFAGLLLDQLFETSWFGDNFYLSKKFQVCSGLVAYTRELIGKDFGVKAAGATPGEISAFCDSEKGRLIYKQEVLK